MFQWANNRGKTEWWKAEKKQTMRCEVILQELKTFEYVYKIWQSVSFWQMCDRIHLYCYFICALARILKKMDWTYGWMWYINKYFLKKLYKNLTHKIQWLLWAIQFGFPSTIWEGTLIFQTNRYSQSYNFRSANVLAYFFSFSDI